MNLPDLDASGSAEFPKTIFSTGLMDPGVLGWFCSPLLEVEEHSEGRELRLSQISSKMVL